MNKSSMNQVAGWGDLGVNGQIFRETPNIDRLAQRGGKPVLPVQYTFYSIQCTDMFSFVH